LAALTLTPIAAEESEGPSELSGRMHTFLNFLAQRNGSEYLTELVIVLARANGTGPPELLEAPEVEALEGHDAGL
jgi:hypothetical protein